MSLVCGATVRVDRLSVEAIDVLETHMEGVLQYTQAGWGTKLRA